MTKKPPLADILGMKKTYNPTDLMKKAAGKIQAAAKKLPTFKVGDTVRVSVRVTEGDKTRVQVFEGVVISKSKGELGGRFVVRKVSYGVGVERIFPMVSPVIEKLVVISRGEVRRAKLYYLRELSGRSARIKADLVFGEEASSPEGESNAEPTVTAQAVQG